MMDRKTLLSKDEEVVIVAYYKMKATRGLSSTQKILAMNLNEVFINHKY